MTDLPPPDPDDLDDLVSAVLDGEATAAEIARVESDPELAARLERLRAMADRIGTAPEPAAGLVDDAVAAALTHLAPGADRPPAPEFDELSARRATRARRFAPLLAAAAAVVVVAASVVAIQRIDSRESQDLATTGQAVEAEDSGADGADALDDPTESADPAALPTAPAADSFTSFSVSAPDLEGFENQVRDLLTEDAVTTTTVGSPGEAAEQDPEEAALRCASPDLAGLGAPVLVGQGRLDGAPVTYQVVLVEGDEVLFITDEACEVIAEVAL